MRREFGDEELDELKRCCWEIRDIVVKTVPGDSRNMMYDAMLSVCNPLRNMSFLLPNDEGEEKVRCNRFRLEWLYTWAAVGRGTARLTALVVRTVLIRMLLGYDNSLFNSATSIAVTPLAHIKDLDKGLENWISSESKVFMGGDRFSWLDVYLFQTIRREGRDIGFWRTLRILRVMGRKGHQSLMLDQIVRPRLIIYGVTGYARLVYGYVVSSRAIRRVVNKYKRPGLMKVVRENVVGRDGARHLWDRVLLSELSRRVDSKQVLALFENSTWESSLMRSISSRIGGKKRSVFWDCSTFASRFYIPYSLDSIVYASSSNIFLVNNSISEETVSALANGNILRYRTKRYEQTIWNGDRQNIKCDRSRQILVLLDINTRSSKEMLEMVRRASRRLKDWYFTVKMHPAAVVDFDMEDERVFSYDSKSDNRISAVLSSSATSSLVGFVEEGFKTAYYVTKSIGIDISPMRFMEGVRCLADESEVVEWIENEDFCLCYKRVLY